MTPPSHAKSQISGTWVRSCDTFLAKIISGTWDDSNTNAFEMWSLSVGQAGLEPIIILSVQGLRVCARYHNQLRCPLLTSVEHLSPVTIQRLQKQPPFPLGFSSPLFSPSLFRNSLCSPPSPDTGLSFPGAGIPDMSHMLDSPFPEHGMSDGH